MLITLIGLAVIVLFGIVGVFRGVLRILAAFASLALAALLARPVSFLFEWAVAGSDMVPLALVPIAALLGTAIILFLIFLIVAELLIRRRERQREESDLPKMESWERWLGGGLGAIWGFVLVLLTLTGLHVVGIVEEVVTAGPPQPVDDRVATRSQAGAPKEADDPFVQLKDEIESSAFGAAVVKASPVDERVQGVFQDLITVVSDPVLFEKFQSDPDIARFAEDPRILAVAQDEEIQEKIRAQSYYELLDNEKIAALLQEKDLYAELSKVDLGRILREVIEQDREAP
ncbi:MAG: hypothetical protein AB1714_13540 [Acidobacteriota bacterium]